MLGASASSGSLNNFVTSAGTSLFVKLGIVLICQSLKFLILFSFKISFFILLLNS